MSLKQSYFRYRISFAKIDAARFIGHLDLQSLFQKAIKRAQLPVAYSEGFNPHQLLSFAAPLPLGMSGHKEILEVFMIHEVPCVQIISSLQKQLPKGIEIVEVEEVSAIGKSAAAIIKKAIYSIYFSEKLDLEKIVQKVLESESIEVEKKSKKGMTKTDIRPDIHDIKVDTANCMRAILACGSERNLKPEILTKYILNVSDIMPQSCDIIFERLAIGQEVSPL